MKVDLHFHFRRRKSDRKDRLRLMVQKAESSGIGGIVLLDHQWFADDETLDIARQAAPSIVFWRGCELTIEDEARGFKDDIVIACDQPIDFDTSERLTTRNIGLLVKAIEGRDDVLTMLAHPFRKHYAIAFDFHQFRPDLIEAIGRANNPEALSSVVKLASAWRMVLASTSDAHSVRHVGRHCMDFLINPKTVKELLQACRLSQYKLIAGECVS